jgi:hypothetical protein
VSRIKEDSMGISICTQVAEKGKGIKLHEVRLLKIKSEMQQLEKRETKLQARLSGQGADNPAPEIFLKICCKVPDLVDQQEAHHTK